MQNLGFVASWVCGAGAMFASRSSATPAVSSSRQPSMALRGHEELETLFDAGDFKTAKYRLDLSISGEMSKENRKLSIQQVKKNGNFNGFRKGTVPPFVMKQINEFVLRDCIETEIRDACDKLGMKLLEGEGADPDFDFKDLQSRFEIGTDCDFSLEIALQTDYKKAADDDEKAASTENAEVAAAAE